MSSDKTLLIGTVKGLSLVMAYIITTPLEREISDVFGNTLLYHPLAIWLTLFSLVWANTDSVKAGLTVIIVYELIKRVWSLSTPQRPYVSKLQKLIHRVHNKEMLSKSDLAFLNEITPENIAIVEKTTNEFQPLRKLL